MSTDPPAAVREATLAAYRAAVVDVVIDAEWLDGSAARRRVGEDLFVLTAWNPGDERPTGAENRRRNVELFDWIVERGWPCWAAVGSSGPGHDTSSGSAWFEEGFAVAGATLTEALELGRAFRQVAIFQLCADERLMWFCFDPQERGGRGKNPEVRAT